MSNKDENQQYCEYCNRKQNHVWPYRYEVDEIPRVALLCGPCYDMMERHKTDQLIGFPITDEDGHIVGHVTTIKDRHWYGKLVPHLSLPLLSIDINNDMCGSMNMSMELEPNIKPDNSINIEGSPLTTDAIYKKIHKNIKPRKGACCYVDFDGTSHTSSLVKLVNEKEK